MGYTIMIGQANVDIDHQYLSVSISVVSERHENAPAFGEPTDYTNSRWPSYTSWNDTIRFAGLEDLFFNKEKGIMRDHPGVFPLNAYHEKEIFIAIVKLKQKYPEAKAGYSPRLPNTVFEDPQWPIVNNYLVRLEWLLYWVNWAVENCEKPVIYNS